MSDPQIRLVEPAGPPANQPARRPLGRLLVEQGLITTTDLLDALGQQRFGDAQLGHFLVARGLISDADLAQVLALQWQLAFLDRSTRRADPTLMAGIDPHLCLTIEAVPWEKLESGTLVATSAPERRDEITRAFPAHFHPLTLAVASRQDIQDAIHSGGSIRLTERAETLVPDPLSCRNLPALLRAIGVVIACTLALALLMQWLVFTDLLLSLFVFSITMVLVGMAIKTAGACLQLLSKAPILARPATPPERLPQVSLLVPLHRETEILPALLDRLKLLSYPKALLDVIFVVEEHDHHMRDHLARLPLPRWIRVLIVPAGQITTKPRAMNYALPYCKGSILGIYDAEDAPDPDQIMNVVATFDSHPEKVACIQAVLDFYNSHDTVITRFFAIEYATWFRLILPGLARMGFAIPLGGTSVFFRRNVLEQLHGWDAHNVTEDADLGIRLARAGYQTMLINSVTYEEANWAVWPWIKQRSRWLKGYVITYLNHMRNPMRLLFELGAWKFLGFQAFFLSSISQYMLAPLIWSCMALYFGAPHWMQAAMPPSFLTNLMLAFSFMWAASTGIYILAIWGVEKRALLPWTLGMSLYMSLGTLAVYKGIYEIARKPFYWEKTAHGRNAGKRASPKR